MAHPNVEIVERALKAFLAGDQAGFVDQLADDILVHIPGSNPLAGDYKGKQEFVERFVGTVMQLTGGNLKIERHDIIGSDQHVVGIYTLTATRDGKTASWLHTNVYHTRDGKISEIWWNPVEQDVVDSLLA